MSRKEAYQLAQSRGYTGKFISNLSRDIASGENNFGLAMIPIEERKPGAWAKNFIDVGKG